MEAREKFASWAILELMGHRRLAGFVQEADLAGVGLLRIDIPCEPPATQFYGAGSVYCLTPTTEATARAVAAMCAPAPVSRWELPAASTEALAVADHHDDDRDADTPI